MAKHEYERTCNRCGTTWFVPEELAKAKPEKTSNLAWWTTPLVGRKKQQLNVERSMIAMRNETLIKAGQCGNCGSGSYSERKVKV
jgi:ribosomal protein S27AE